MKKGFTLIELLTVISLIAIISVLALTNVTSNINRQKDNISNVTKTLILEAAEDYVNESEKLSNSDESFCIKIKDLISNNYLSSNMLKENGGELDEKLKIFVDKNKSFEYTIDTDNVCSLYSFPNDDLIDSLKKDDNSGLVADAYEPGRYYFRGVDPKNRIILQETDGPTPYRIISFEKDGTIKVVRENKLVIPDNSWDTGYGRDASVDTYCVDLLPNGCNAWGNMTNTYRNNQVMGDYFSLKFYESATATEMTTFGSENGIKTKVVNNSGMNEYLNGDYLTYDLVPIRKYLYEQMWDVGGVSDISKDFAKDIEESKVNQWKGYIALASIIDFKNASGNTTECVNVYSTSVDNNLTYYPCIKNSDGTVNNYLYISNNNQWSLTAFEDVYSGVWIVTIDGYFEVNPASEFRAVRPAFYLKPTVKLTGGGTVGNEFTITEE